MKIPTLKRLVTEDFQDAPSWVTKLFSPLNRLIDLFGTTLNRGLTFSDNIACAIVTVDAKPSDLPLKVRATLNDRGFKPAGVIVLEVRDKAAPEQTQTLGNPSWSWNGVDQVIIHSISGLTTGHLYTFKLLILAG